MAARTFAGATRAFLGTATWLTAEDEPMVIGLKTMARELDKQYLAATYTQYRHTYNALLEKRADGGSEKDPLEALLDG